MLGMSSHLCSLPDRFRSPWLSGLPSAVGPHNARVANSCFIVWGCKIELLGYKSKLHLTAQGSYQFLVSVTEAISWLCAAIRKPDVQGLKLSSAEMGDPNLIRLHLQQAELDANPSCWHKLFKAGFIVSSDVPLEGRGQGLEISFDDMANLAAAVLEVEINGVPVLVGQSTMLIPVEHLETGIQWHLEIWESGLMDPAKGESLLSILEKHPKTLKEDMAVLRQKKAFLGWSSSQTPVQVILGTQQASEACQSLRSSGADHIRPKVTEGTDDEMACELKFRFLALRGGRKIRWGQFNVQTLSFTVARAFDMVLQAPGDKSAAVYDTATRRGWLLPRLDVLLHMVHVRLRQERDSLVGYSNPQRSARDVLDDHRDIIVRGLSLQDFVLGLSTGLDATTNGLRQHVRRDESRLIGVELFDLAFSEQGGPLELKRAKLAKSACGWAGLLDYSWVLFCAGLGEAIRPSAEENLAACTERSVRTGHDYLAAMIPCLKHLAACSGGDWETGGLGKGVFMTRAAKLSECGSDGCCCVQLRKLSKTDGPHDPVDDRCATVFGT